MRCNVICQNVRHYTYHCASGYGGYMVIPLSIRFGIRTDINHFHPQPDYATFRRDRWRSPPSRHLQVLQSTYLGLFWASKGSPGGIDICSLAW